MVTLGTGVGGGIIINNQILKKGKTELLEKCILKCIQIKDGNAHAVPGIVLKYTLPVQD